ncbi:hypothetical protein [Aquamicrobium soli]|uniref:Uncharacterized protein n=1 Tax=Aquamicrobium soli TaxID=1811518 RepID=A0ABV7KII3_9HYPH
MTKKARKDRPPRAFEDAILTFVSETGKAQSELTRAMLRLPVCDWIAAKKYLTRWIEIGSSGAKVFQQVIDAVDYEISRADGERK